LRNGVALPDLSGTAEIRRRSKYILSLGRLGRRKGTFDLVAAFSRIAAERPEWRLICAGHGDVAQTRSLAKEVGIADRVECPGWIDSDTAQQLLAAATVFALPSRMEGLPMALLEAMSWRLPVVTSPVGGIPQLVRHDYNGLLVAPGDVDALAAALGTLMDDEVARERLAGAARATITTEFSRDEIVGQLGRVYRRFGIPARDPAAAAPQ
jgi:glycosyltransferase involved in cell wall biosynthesis